MNAPDMRDLRGEPMQRVVRSVEAALYERANMLLVGPPGIGKTMVARRIPSIMPPLDHEHAQRWLTIEHDACGLLDRHDEPFDPYAIKTRPFRAPHYSISTGGLVGMPWSGQYAAWMRVGELRLARFGVLFLDELPEFSRSALTCLRESLLKMGATAPIVVGSACPCPCGWIDEPCRYTCTCSYVTRMTFNERVCLYADALNMRQIDVPYATLQSIKVARDQPCEDSAAIQARVTERTFA